MLGVRRGSPLAALGSHLYYREHHYIAYFKNFNL